MAQEYNGPRPTAFTKKKKEQTPPSTTLQPSTNTQGNYVNNSPLPSFTAMGFTPTSKRNLPQPQPRSPENVAKTQKIMEDFRAGVKDKVTSGAFLDPIIPKNVRTMLGAKAQLMGQDIVNGVKNLGSDIKETFQLGGDAFRPDKIRERYLAKMQGETPPEPVEQVEPVEPVEQVEQVATLEQEPRESPEPTPTIDPRYGVFMKNDLNLAPSLRINTPSLIPSELSLTSPNMQGGEYIPNITDPNIEAPTFPEEQPQPRPIIQPQPRPIIQPQPRPIIQPQPRPKVTYGKGITEDWDVKEGLISEEEAQARREEAGVLTEEGLNQAKQQYEQMTPAQKMLYKADMQGGAPRPKVTAPSEPTAPVGTMSSQGVYTPPPREVGLQKLIEDRPEVANLKPEQQNKLLKAYYKVMEAQHNIQKGGEAPKKEKEELNFQNVYSSNQKEIEKWGRDYAQQLRRGDNTRGKIGSSPLSEQMQIDLQQFEDLRKNNPRELTRLWMTATGRL